MAANSTEVNGNGRGRPVAEIVAYGATLAAVLAPMWASLSSTASLLAQLDARTKDERDRMEARVVSHSDDNYGKMEDRALILEANIRHLEERAGAGETATRALEAKLAGVLAENESQHNAIADTIRALRMVTELRDRAYWDGARIVWPDVAWPYLEKIGEATVPNGNGHK